MAGTPLVSVGIPFRNPGRFLEDAIRSVFSQTISDWELILVNDGSNDGSVSLAKRVADPRVRLIDDGKALGLVPRLNQLIDLSRGRYIARMDADDMMHPMRLETQLEFLENHKDFDVVDCGAIVLDRNQTPVGVRRAKNRSVDEVLKWGSVLHPSVLARSEWYKAHRYDASFPRAEDRELFLRVHHEGRLAHIAEPLYFYFFVGNVRIRAFLTSYRSERKALLRYGPRLVGYPRTVALLGRSLLKSAALPILATLGITRPLFRNAYEPIPNGLAVAANNTIREIKQTQVPGWE